MADRKKYFVNDKINFYVLLDHIKNVLCILQISEIWDSSSSSML